MKASEVRMVESLKEDLQAEQNERKRILKFLREKYPNVLNADAYCF